MKKLNLNKEVIATLNDDSMNRVKGGGVCATFEADCKTIPPQATCQCPPIVISVELSNCPLCISPF